jgi:hypothetical protein
MAIPKLHSISEEIHIHWNNSSSALSTTSSIGLATCFQGETQCQSPVAPLQVDFADSKSDMEAENSEYEFDGQLELVRNPKSADIQNEKVAIGFGRAATNIFPQIWHYICHRELAVYFGIFGILFLVNLTGVLLVLCKDRPFFDSKNMLAVYQNIPSYVAANILAACLIRNEHMVNFLFQMVFLVPGRASLWLRSKIANVYQYGGVHAACGLAAVVWVLVNISVTFSLFWRGILRDPALLCVNCTIGVLILISSIFALPFLRHKYHNCFERVHRYAGWFIIMLSYASGPLTGRALGRLHPDLTKSRWFQSPALWLLITTTILIAYPWLRVRRRSVECIQLSPHALLLKVRGLSGRGGSAIRVSHSFLGQYHAFAIIPDAEDRTCFSLIMSNAGDWTSNLISHPPSKLYFRDCYALGVMSVAQIFQPVVVLATGSGIGPCLGMFVSLPNHQFRVIWSTRSPVKTYSAQIVQKVCDADPNAIIRDTDVSGRCDLAALAEATYHEVGAEAMIVISNRQVTAELHKILTAKGLHYFAPIFDS